MAKPMDSKQKEIIKDNLETLRCQNKLNKREMAEIMEINSSIYSRYVDCSYTDAPNIDTLVIVSKHFHVSVDWLLGIDEPNSQCYSVHDICSMLVSIDSALGFTQEIKKDTRNAAKGIDKIPENSSTSKDGTIPIKTEYRMIYFPDVNTNEENQYNYDGMEINNFLQKYAGLKEAHSQGLIDDNIFHEAVALQLKKLSTDDIQYSYDRTIQIEEAETPTPPANILG